MSAANYSNDGRSFERSIETINGQYERQHRATISKVEPPCRILGWGAARRVIFLESPWLDFSGCWTANGGRAIHFEAKSTIEPILPAGGQRSLKQTQIQAMQRWQAAGAATWLLWQLAGQVTFWTVAMILAGLAQHKSLVFGDGHVVEAGNGFVFHDFLSTAKRFEKYL